MYLDNLQFGRTRRLLLSVSRVLPVVCIRFRNARGVEMVPNQVMSEMVLDGGGQFIPAGIFSFSTLSLFLASLVAHDRATEDTRTHIGKEHQSTNTRDT